MPQCVLERQKSARIVHLVRRRNANVFVLGAALGLAACGGHTSVDEGEPQDSSGGAPSGAGGASGGAGTAGFVATGGTTIPVGGSGGTGAYTPPPDSDDDGIPDDVERRAGTDPFRPDSDGDGCDDLLEARFGECDLDTMASVFSCAGEARLVLTIGSGSGARMSDVSTRVVPVEGGIEEDLWARATQIDPAEAGELGELDSLASVDPGARVTFVVVPNLVFRWNAIHTYRIRVVSDTAGTLAEGNIVWRRRDCPAPELE
jgi:hypothetical protein